MSQLADISLTLPTAPAQLVPQTDRVVAATGSTIPIPATVPNGTTQINLQCALDGTISFQVQEQITVGGQTVLSEPCKIDIIPLQAIKPVAADPKGFVVQVTAIHDAPAA